MAAYYLDTSALVKRYVREPGTGRITHLTDPNAGNDVYTIILAGVEIVAALFRKARIGEISPQEAVRAANNFRIDWQTHYQIVEADSPLVDAAMEVAERHGLRGYDAAHLAAALIVQLARQAARLQPLTFVSADHAQLQAAVAEGLGVEDPNTHP